MRIRTLAGTVKRFLYQRYTDVIITCDLTQPLPLPCRHAMEIAPIEPRHEPFLLDLARRAGARPSSIQAYLRLGYQGFLTVRDGACAGYVWWTDADALPGNQHPHVRRYNLRLHEGEAYLFDLLVDPRYRGGGNATNFAIAVLRALRERGYHRVWGNVAADNLQARLLYRMLNWKERERYVSRRFLRRILYADRRLFVRNTQRDRVALDWREVARFRPAGETAVQNGAGSSRGSPGPSLEYTSDGT